MINKDYLKNLNEAQKEAVLHLDGPLLIVAGAGSGKTKVLTSRIANLIKEKKAFPNQILAVTFTNKAAKEMKERVMKLLKTNELDLSMGTFHSICARILREDIEVLGFSKHFAIYDVKDQFIIVDTEELHQYLKDNRSKVVHLWELISKLEWNIILPKN